MKEFWKWMEKKEYATDIEVFEGETMGLVLDMNGDGCVLTIQMEIGYMIEYLMENSIAVGIGTKHKINNSDSVVESIEEYHDRLIKEVKRVKSRES